MNFQEIVKSIDLLSADDRDKLYELIHQRRIEDRQISILTNYRELLQSIEDGSVKKGNINDLISDLLEDNDGSIME